LHFIWSGHGNRNILKCEDLWSTVRPQYNSSHEQDLAQAIFC